MRYLICLVLGLAPLLAAADVVTPSAQVQDGATVYETPAKSERTMGSIPKGQSAKLIGSVPHWHQVQLDSGAVGYVNKASVTVRKETPAEAAAPTASAPDYVIDVIDVGTGLSIFAHGKDFSVLYDGGSNDDEALGDSNRTVAYLRAAWPAVKRIDHVILSHPHKDHVELLPDVLARYEVANLWDSGRFHDICGYRALLAAASTEPGLKYHDAVSDKQPRTVKFEKKNCAGRGKLPETIKLPNDSVIDSEKPIRLSADASMTIVYASAHKGSDPNDNSLVVRMDLGKHRILFMGDAGGGERAAVKDPPKKKSIEGALLECCGKDIKADILIAGHHGSMTSSREDFIKQVGARDYIVSAGPTKYSDVVLPDKEVVDMLVTHGSVYRTDANDKTCGSAAEKIGPDEDKKPGGCDNIRISLGRDSSAIDYLTLR